VALMDDFAPRLVADSALKDRSPARRTLHRTLAARSRAKRIVRRDDVLRVSPQAALCVLFPPPGWQRPTADDKALVLRLELDGLRVLFTSDNGFAAESWLAQHEPDLRADVVVKGQHARDVSGTLDFLLKVQPKAVVCAAPEFGAPGGGLDAWTSSVQGRGIEVFRQDRTGAVRIEWRRSDGELRLRSHLGDQTFRSRTR
jgi:beta-lactamase superfamily II metal-dependent hydrolase